MLVIVAKWQAIGRIPIEILPQQALIGRRHRPDGGGVLKTDRGEFRQIAAMDNCSTETLQKTPRNEYIVIVDGNRVFECPEFRDADEFGAQLRPWNGKIIDALLVLIDDIKLAINEMLPLAFTPGERPFGRQRQPDTGDRRLVRRAIRKHE